MASISPATLRDWIADGAELAVLDAREEGEFGSGHLFWAVPCPLSRARLRLPALLPRITVRVVCVDDGRGLAERLAAAIVAAGGTDVHGLAGGIAGWEAAGHVLFTGVNVPSKAFGEWVEHQYGTESVDAAELAAWQAEGRDLIVLDSRPMDEFHRMSIPGGVNVPGGELAYRVADLVPDANTLIVVNCAGRTRSILGAESLRRAGVPNRVLALRNGTMGWSLAGLEVARGQTARYAEGTPQSAALARQRASAFAEASGVGVIGPLDLTRFEDDPERTLYVLDVRGPAEYAAGHRPGSRSAPGGQLIQATDTWIGVRGARIALVDDDGVRARMAGAWLRQMGHRDVFVVEGGLGEAAPTPPAEPVGGIDAIPAGALVLDLARSIEFRAGHIPGALWGVPTRLEPLRGRLRAASHVVLVSPDGILAQDAADEVAGMTEAPVSVLRGGTRAWVAGGGALEASRAEPADEACIDFYLRPYDRTSGIEEAMHAYLSWEIDLVREIERDGTVAFGV